MSLSAAYLMKSPERLLLRCISATTSRADLQRDLASAALDWPAVWELAARQQVQPLVARALADDCLAAHLPPEARIDIKSARLETTVQNLASQAELAAIAGLLEARGIFVIPLKGTHLACRLYGSLDARRCGDIDILVREEDWATARALLVDYGYRPMASSRPGVQRHAFHGIPLLRIANGRGFVVELHRQLSDPRFLAIDHADLWRRALAAGAHDGCMYDLPAEELLLFLALHLPKHDAGLLRLLADIDRLVAGEQTTIDWKYLLTLAADWRAQVLLAFALEWTAMLLGTPVPESTRRALQPSPWRRTLVPFLTGPRAILHPPKRDHVRANRFRMAYCMMLTPVPTMLRAYWHYILAPPASGSEHAWGKLTHAFLRPLDGLTWTSVAIGSAVRDRRRRAARLNES